MERKFGSSQKPRLEHMIKKGSVSEAEYLSAKLSEIFRYRGRGSVVCFAGLARAQLCVCEFKASGQLRNSIDSLVRRRKLLFGWNQ